MRKGRIIDSHAHLVQYIAGTGAGGELRSIGNGMAVYANGQNVMMIPQEFGGDQVTPEHLLQVMDKNGVEKAVLLQGNFYGYQNYYTHLAVKKYPDRFAGAGAGTVKRKGPAILPQSAPAQGTQRAVTTCRKSRPDLSEKRTGS